MSEKSQNAKTAQTSPIDVEKQGDGAKTAPRPDGTDDNNHFFEEKVKERAPPGLNGSLIFLYSLFFAMFTIGWVYINKCPLNQLIPIFLIIAGFLGALAKHLSKYDNKPCFWGTVALVIVDVLWHGVGSYVVYKEYQPSYNSTDPSYCNRTTYLVAFWTLTIEYTLLLFFIVLSCCYMMMRKDFRMESRSK